MSTVFMYMFSYVNVFGVPVPQPSSVSVYLRVRVKSTVYVNPRLLVPGSPVHHDRRRVPFSFVNNFSPVFG